MVFNNYLNMTIYFIAVGILECVYFNILIFSQYFLNTNLNTDFFFYFFFQNWIEHFRFEVLFCCVVQNIGCWMLFVWFLLVFIQCIKPFEYSVYYPNYRGILNQSFIGICRVHCANYWRHPQWNRCTMIAVNMNNSVNFTTKR